MSDLTPKQALFRDGFSDVASSAEDAHRVFARTYSQADLDAAVAAERGRCVRILRRAHQSHTSPTVLNALEACLQEILDADPSHPTKGS